MTKKLKFTLAIALNEILEIFIRREESEVISKLNFSIEKFDYPEIKNYWNLLETFKCFAKKIQPEFFIFEPFAIIPFINDKVIAFSCSENYNQIPDKSIIFRLSEENFVVNAFKNDKNDIITAVNYEDLNIFSELDDFQSELKELIYFFLTLPNKDIVILGLSMIIPEKSQDFEWNLKNALKIFKNNIETKICSNLNFKNKILSLDHDFSSKQSFLDKIINNFQESVKFETLETQILTKNQTWGKLIWPASVNKTSENFYIFDSIMIDFKKPKEDKTIDWSIFLSKEFSQQTPFENNCYLTSEEIREKIGFELNSSNLKNVLFFGFILKDSLQIIFGLTNVDEVFDSFENLHEKIRNFVEFQFYMQSKKIENNFRCLESLLTKKKKNISLKKGLEVLGKFNNKRKQLFFIWSKIDKFLQNKLSIEFFNKFKKANKLKQTLKNLIFAHKIRIHNLEALENRIILDKFFRISSILSRKQRTLLKIGQIFKFAQIRIKLKTFHHLTRFLYYFNTQSHQNKNLHANYFFLEYEEKLESILSTPCKIGLIIKNYNGMVFWKNNDESFFFLNMKNANIIKDKVLENIDNGFMITQFSKETRKLFHYKFDFQKYAIYIELLANTTLKMEGICKKIEYFISENLTNFQNFILKFIMKKASFIFLMK